jgi:hypothetical protein
MYFSMPESRFIGRSMLGLTAELRMHSVLWAAHDAPTLSG